MSGAPVGVVVQVVGYETVDAALQVADSGAVSRLPLKAGQELAYQLGDRRCAGVVHDGIHTTCSARTAPYCREHTVPWSVANNADSDEQHVVYLAAFAPEAFKVGVTRTWRLERRLREQGADRAAAVETAPNGRVARDRESAIATDADIPERVRVSSKIRGLDDEVDKGAWERLLGEFDVIERFEFDYGLDLDIRPIMETMLTGTVRGTKGRVLVIEHAGGTFAVDMRDLVGYELKEGKTENEVQSSLGAFS